MADASRNEDAEPRWAEVEELAGAVEAVYYAMRRARSATALQSAEGLSTAQVTMLEPLLDENGLSTGRLAQAASVSLPTATRMLKQLETRGYVRRDRSPEDDRVVLTRLTERGREILSEIRERLRERQVEGLAAFDPAERADLARQLRRLAGVISETR
jgi:MarR family transcriptional regulator, organic hydroperoxide resistance regulator